MADAIIEFPQGQHATAGSHLQLKITYTGNPPGPDDVHVSTRETGTSDWAELMGMDVDPATAAQGIDLTIPVGTGTGAFDIRVEWTWKDPPRREEGRVGQYFVDPARPKPSPPSDAPDDDAGEGTPWWKYALLPVTGPFELALLLVYAPFWLLDLLGFGNRLGNAIRALIKAIRDNLLPPPFSGWGK